MTRRRIYIAILNERSRILNERSMICNTHSVKGNIPRVHSDSLWVLRLCVIGIFFFSTFLKLFYYALVLYSEKLVIH